MPDIREQETIRVIKADGTRATQVSMASDRMF